MQLEERLLSFYGDDFTGSTDAMEALTLSGLRTILFLEPPTKELLDEKFADVPCIGVAGTSRTMSPEQMEKDLKPILKQIQELGASINHYKICSTFDSSPTVGNIGKVLEMILEINHTQDFVPIIAGATPLQRYTVFGNHFASMDSKTFRLDEHPVMSRHPITPMQEADLIKHLSKQTSYPIDLVDVLSMDDHFTELEATVERIVTKQKPKGLLFDMLTSNHLTKIGKFIYEESKEKPLFVIGSSGVEYALTNYWNSMQGLKKQEANVDKINKTEKEQVLVVSGSCSPITSEQIKHALDNGFTGLKVSPVRLIDPKTSSSYFHDLMNTVTELINAGENVIVYSALGSDDSSIEETREYLQSIGAEPTSSGQLLGEQFGKLIKKTVENTSLNRIVIAGGDTSSYATQEMRIYALEMIRSVAPGAPLCKTYSNTQRFDGLEIALKGGQLGQVDYFSKVHLGSSVTV
ncbi:four-carbon acid sugar kinase family protein [Oceanobacillus oncorhynchi]|uniref:four-carbon acid sugar kinase family protein n=1 Tax=Oceanobacillus oncorhynchi TaxID=545501 RepID=UPI002115DF43|nr:four-carbon acid sugar kinase family protein [Oceanobacillus oncorhynchi]UUI39518.1 four-carbon acid sugar kinase family protein [Oceanobacillus oncorhynchi]